MTPPPHTDLNDILVPLALRAGALIMDIYEGDFDFDLKSDDSPVTLADQKAELLIVETLRDKFPDITIVAEEMSAAGDIAEGGSLFFLVDPLDGTREFIARRDEFTVNIGLIFEGKPYYGIVFAPAIGALYVSLSATKAGFAQISMPLHEPDIAVVSKEISFKEISVREWPGTEAVAVASRSHIDDETIDFLDKNGITARTNSGSSLKFCEVAHGKADIYPRFSPTMEWDTAAGHGVLQAAGGVVVTGKGQPFSYGKFNEDYRNGPFIACASSAIDALLIG